MRPLLALALICAWQAPARTQGPVERKPRLIGVVDVGRVAEDCEHIQKEGRRAEVPTGFLFTPDMAFRRALDQIKFRCPSQYGNRVFADETYYYITVGPAEKNLEAAGRDLTSIALRKIAVRVHGLTGRVLPPENLN